MKKCKKCGGVLYFEPSTQNLRCTKCEDEYTFQKIKKFDKHTFDMSTKTMEKTITANDFKMRCPNCGGICDGDTFAISDICKYCGSTLAMNLEDGIAPDAVVPFEFNKKEAKEKFKLGLKKKWFLPNKLKKCKIKEEIESVYIPVYMCDVSTRNTYVGKLYTKTRHANGDQSIKTHRISGMEDVQEKDLLVECSKYLSQITLKKITPYQISSAVKFSPNYLMGYSVEYYDKNLEGCKASVKAMATANVRQKILSHYTYDEVGYLDIKTEYYDCKYAKIILPTYRIKYKFGKKDYTTFMNGQTGKVGGNLPRSPWKITAFVAGILLGIGALAYLIYTFCM